MKREQFDYVYDSVRAAQNLFGSFLRHFVMTAQEVFPEVCAEQGISWRLFADCERVSNEIYRLIFWEDAARESTVHIEVDSRMISHPNGPEFKDYFLTLWAEIQLRKAEERKKKGLSEFPQPAEVVRLSERREA